VAFSKLYESEDSVRRAIAVAKAMPFQVSLEPLVVGGPDAFHEAVDSTESSEAAPSRGIPPLFKADTANLTVSASEMRAANARGEALGLTEDELSFYDALETNDSAVKILGDETLRTIARELVATVRSNVTIDWTLRENVRAQLRVLVKRILRKHGYPPDKQEKATQTVLE
jgi:Domain of unknown function (DUF3387)